MSGDVMMFPDTVEEFMEQYKVVDREQVYSNGIEFVPIFRMQQWFDHVKNSPDDLRGVGYNKNSEYPSLFLCSVCGWHCDDTYCCDTATFNYCPSCGARMKGD